MFKYLPLVLVLLSTSVVADNSKWYIGTGIGQAKPQIELDEDVTKSTSIDVGGNKYEVPVSVDSKFTSYGQKLFLGYDVGDEKGFAFELSIVNFGNYRGILNASIGDSGTIESQYFDTVPYSLYVLGDQLIKADLYSTTLSMIYSFQIGNRVSIFPRFGLSYIRGDVYIENTIILSATLGDNNESISWSEREKDNLKAYIPVFGVGVDVAINKQHFIRTEFERYGHPSQEYVDMYSILWGYRFK